MSEPIQPASVRKAGERTDGDSDDMPVVDAMVKPPTAPTAVPPPRPSEPPTAGTTSGSAGAGAPSGPGNWWRDADTPGPASSSAPVPAPVPVYAGGGSGWSGGGGGTATMVAPVYLPPAPATYTYTYIVQAAPPAAPLERRFDVRRIHPVRNGLALAIGTVVARAVWNPVLHVFGDAYGVVLLGLTGALLLEWAWHDKLKVRWLVRVHTCSWAAAGIVTPAGLLGLAFIGTGAA